jgi:hypothetical protein
MQPLQDVVTIELTEPEWTMLGRTMMEWGGAARCTDVMAEAMGFGNVDGLFAETDRFLDLTRAHLPMSRWDWARLLLATEIVFASTVVGSGLSWDTGDVRVTDEESFRTLRSLQRKVMATVARDVMREEELGRSDAAVAAAERTRWPR